MTALDNGNPRGGWNIIPQSETVAGPGRRKSKRRANGSEKDDESEGRDERRGALSCESRYFVEVLIYLASLRVQSPSDAVFIFGRGVGVYMRPIHFVIE